MAIPKKPSFWFDERAVVKAVQQASSAPLERAALLLEREVKTSMKSGGGEAKVSSQPGSVPMFKLEIFVRLLGQQS